MRTPTRLLAITTAAWLATASAQAAGSSSANYSITADTVDIAGATASSADYSQVASAGSITSISSEATSGYVVKSGYVGQLYEVTGVIPTAPVPEVVEGASIQLGAAQVLDDATLLPFPASLATWSIANGPMTAITSGGFATAALVYQNTPATVRISSLGFTGTLSLTVMNASTDDYGAYAADGLPDEWQVQYFGPDNPHAAPTHDATGSGQNNLFKYVADLDPTDPSDVFRVSVHPVEGQAGQKQIVIVPIASGRTYTVLYKENLTDATWMPLAGATASDNGQQRTVTDMNASGKAKFYKVQISQP